MVLCESKAAVCTADKGQLNASRVKADRSTQYIEHKIKKCIAGIRLKSKWTKPPQTSTKSDLVGTTQELQHRDTGNRPVM